MNTSKYPLFATAVLGALVAFAVPTASAKSDADERAEVDKTAATVLADLYKEKPEAEKSVQNAEGYAVFSNVGVNVIFASFAGGSGVVVDKAGKRTYMKMGSAGVGIGLGVKDFRAVFVFHSKDKLEKFVDKGWDFSGQADAAAKSDEKGGAAAAAADLGKDVDVYQLTKTGLALQATLQGTKYWKNDDLN